MRAMRMFLKLVFGLMLFSFLISYNSTHAVEASQENSITGQVEQKALWEEVMETDAMRGLERTLIPSAYRTLALDTTALASLLEQAPLEFTSDAPSIEISLPLPDGNFARFDISYSPVMMPDLAARYPEIQTYSGQGIDDPTMTARLAWTPAGLNAVLVKSNATYFVAPYALGDQTLHISYDILADPYPFALEKPEPGSEGEDAPNIPNAPPYDVGDTLRLYRMAVSSSGEYAQVHGGTVSCTLAAIAVEINEANAIYEREFAMRFVLVSNTDLLIYLNPATDPYPQDDCNTTLFTETQATIDSIIGTANYDAGHLFLRNYCGGVVSGRVGNPSTKARAQSGAAGGMDIALHVFTHEMGHAFNAGHTWSYCNSGTGGQYATTSAYEPGSGNTIMSYNGICGVDNVGEQLYQFHSFSFDQMIAYATEDSVGSLAGYTVQTDNSAPVVNAGSNGFTFPRNTPFVLSGTATDAEGDLLTYSWEELDLAPPTGTPPNSGIAPFFRVFAAVSDGNIRTFPQISDIVNNVTTLGEFLPDPTTTPENLTFRLHT